MIQNIININNGEMNERVEDIIHDILKLTGGILQTKRHNIPLIMTKRGGKSSLIPIMVINLDLPKSYHVGRVEVQYVEYWK
jgi:hypothetical protein